MPELQDIVRDRATDRVNDALADRLARLAVAGRLRITDPAVAAEQLAALLTAPLEARSRFGTRKLSTARARRRHAERGTDFPACLRQRADRAASRQRSIAK
ncbi:TetR/AcrR family transcriptional regulator C-terminal domain-containing protein [Kribbella sp. VKM Ac-2566]|uniref:TetR/AcrR family transcriptional regulator C-terminal domain-containing protein n=1 Tax=Kribbella sp. VKM Ac-2566 TaxID=2512218 RepID=UPI0035168928